jgi:hypothetical protein
LVSSGPQNPSTSPQLLQLAFEALLQASLHQCTEVLHQGVIGAIDLPHPIPLATNQAGPLQLPQLTADVGLAETGEFYQGCHIHGPLFEMAEQLQPSRLAQQPKKLTEFLQQLGAWDGPIRKNTHGTTNNAKEIMQQARLYAHIVMRLSVKG